MTTRRGGGLPLGEGRAGVPLTDMPSTEWVDALRTALTEERPGDERWQHAVQNMTADEANGVPHLSFMTSGVGDADFIVSYYTAIDSAIEKVNAQSV